MLAIKWHDEKDDHRIRNRHGKLKEDPNRADNHEFCTRLLEDNDVDKFYLVGSRTLHSIIAEQQAKIVDRVLRIPLFNARDSD